MRREMDTENPAVGRHVVIAAVVLLVMLALVVTRWWLLCRAHSGAVGTALPSIMPWWKRGATLAWRGKHNALLPSIAAAVLITTATLESHIGTLESALRKVVAYPEEVLADLNTFFPTGEICTSVLATAKQATELYTVPDFNDIGDVVSALWLALGVWAGVVGLQVGISVCEHRSGAPKGRATLLCFCSAGISTVMWLATLALVLAAIVVRTVAAIGCDHVDTPDAARFFFDDEATNNHPFLQETKTQLQQCGAPPQVVRHLEPGALAPQLAAVHNVCDGLQTDLMALVVIATLTFPAAVLVACLRQRAMTVDAK